MKYETSDSQYSGTVYCPTCLHELPFLLPVEPVYDLKLVAQLVPTTYQALRRHLSTHKAHYPPRYRYDSQRRRHRMLSASEVRMLREHILRYKNTDGTPRQPDERGL